MKFLSIFFLFSLSLSTPVPANTDLKANNILDAGVTPTPTPTPIQPIYKIEHTAISTTTTSASVIPTAVVNPQILFNNDQEILDHEKKQNLEKRQYLLRV